MAEACRAAASSLLGTASARTGWWKEIMALAHESRHTAIFGLAYGFLMWDYHPEGVGDGLRTHHSILVFVLGYTGWTPFYLLLGLAAAPLAAPIARGNGLSLSECES